MFQLCKQEGSDVWVKAAHIGCHYEIIYAGTLSSHDQSCSHRDPVMRATSKCPEWGSGPSGREAEDKNQYSSPLLVCVLCLPVSFSLAGSSFDPFEKKKI